MPVYPVQKKKIKNKKREKFHTIQVKTNQQLIAAICKSSKFKVHEQRYVLDKLKKNVNCFFVASHVG